MTLEEAREFYFAYRGHSFHMGREEPDRYNMFRRLGLGGDVLKQWDEELLEGLFRRVRTDPYRAWAAHSEIIDIIRRGNVDIPVWTERLLDEMEDMGSLNAMNRIIILENMAGRTESLKDGGACLVCTHTDLAERMDRIMKDFCEAIDTGDGSCSGQPMGWNDPEGRLERAKSSYETAYFRWHRPKGQ